ncbi:MAG: hypothetical protein AB1505_04430, partial [Candidatus Latescibacterota bacterium]
PWRLGWLLLPRAALLFEVLFSPRIGLVHVLAGSAARLVHQVSLADILVHVSVLAGVAHLVMRTSPVGAGQPEPGSQVPSAA